MSISEDVSAFRGHTDQVVAAAFLGKKENDVNGVNDKDDDGDDDNDESLVLTASEDGALRLFDVASEKCVYAFFNHRAQQYKCLAWKQRTVAGSAVPEIVVVAGNANGMIYVLSTKHPQTRSA